MFDCFHYDSLTQQEVADRWFVPARTLERQAGGERQSLIGYDRTPMFAMLYAQLQTPNQVSQQCLMPVRLMARGTTR